LRTMRSLDKPIFPLKVGRPDRSYFESYKCKVCGGHKGSGDHRKCSKILQKLNQEVL
jgi:hypothetical protein